MAFQESAVFPVPALGAKALILYSIHCVNRNLGALKHELAVYLAAVAGGFATAGTDGFHLLDRVGQLQKAGGTGETAVHKVRPQPIADDRNVQIYRDQKQLLGLRRGKELAFVTQHTGRGAAMGGGIGPDDIQDVHVWADQHIHLVADPQAGNNMIAAFGVHAGFQNQHPHAAFVIIESNLQKRRGFAAVHCAVTVI